MLIFNLICSILCFVFLAFFAGLNLDNRCDIWFFHKFTNVPIYFSILIAFAAGILFGLFVVLFSRSTRKNRKRKEKNEKTAEKISQQSAPEPVKDEKKEQAKPEKKKLPKEKKAFFNFGFRKNKNKEPVKDNSDPVLPQEQNS